MTTADNDIDALIAKLKGYRSFDDPWVRGIEELTSFRKVIAGYLRFAESVRQGQVDATQKWGALDNNVFSEYLRRGYADPEHDAIVFLHRLSWLGHRIQMAPYQDISWDRKWNETEAQWENKKLELEQLLRDAADLFDSGQSDPGMFPSLERSRKNGAKMPNYVLERNGIPPMDIDYWCGSEYLRAWADIILLTPVDVVFPIARSDSGLYGPFKNIGTRGGAAKPESALRAVICREIASYVPESIDDRYSAIADLARYLKMDVTAHYVRSLLMKGRT